MYAYVVLIVSFYLNVVDFVIIFFLLLTIPQKANPVVFIVHSCGPEMRWSLKTEAPLKSSDRATFYNAKFHFFPYRVVLHQPNHQSRLSERREHS